MSSNSYTHPKGGVMEMLSIALPMVISNGCDTIMVFTDRLFLAKLGTEHMSAAMLGGVNVVFVMSFIIGLLNYNTAMTAQYLGAGKFNKCSIATTQAIILSVLSYPFLMLTIPLMHWVFNHGGLAPGQLEYQTQYFDILIYGSVFALLRVVFSSFFSGIGKTRVVMFAAFVAMFTNILVSYVLIFGKFGFVAMGIKGAAMGTISGSVAAVAVLVYTYFREENVNYFKINESFKFVGSELKKLFKFGLPAGIEMFLILASFSALIFVFHSEGLVVASAATILFNWDHVAFVPLLGLEIASTSLVGRYVGAKDYETVEKSVKSGIKSGTIYTLIVVVMFVFFPYFLTDIFKPENAGEVFYQARPIAADMIRIAAGYVAIEAFLFVYAGALRGAGDTFWVMCATVSVNWILVAILFVGMKVFGMSAQASWLLVVIMFFLFPIVLYKRFKKGKWKEYQVV